MVERAGFALLLASVIAAAGCVDSGAGAAQPDANPSGAPPPAKPATFDEATGGIEGTVTDDAFNPMANAQVALADYAGPPAVTDAAGAYSLSNVPPGTYQIFASRLGYDAVQRQLVVRSGEVVQSDFILTQLAITEEYYKTPDQGGNFGCGLSYRPAVFISGVAACGLISGTEYDKFLLRWALAGKVDTWKAVVFEMTWKSNQATGSGLEVLWEVNGCSNSVSARFALSRGQDPLRARLDSEDLEARMKAIAAGTCGGNTCNAKACAIQSRVFSHPNTLGASHAADIGITVQQKFHQYFTEFHGGEGQEDFSVLADR